MTITKYLWDKIGILVSALCLAHCIAMPIIFFAFPTIQVSFLEDQFHKIIFLAMLVVSFAAFVPAFTKHRQLQVLFKATCGILFFVSSIFIGHEFSSYYLELALGVTGSLFLIWAHLSNISCVHKKCSH
jgi:hypothetical protein